MKKIYCVIPAYNERANIQEIIKKLIFLSIDNFHIIVVDDNSPDGTGEIVEEMKKEYPDIVIIHRNEKRGLGTAYVEGFQKALSLGADIIFEMDADLSHDPKYIPQMLEIIKEYDLVLGSRYIQGGGTQNWNFFRRLISRFGNIYAKKILGIPIHDLTSGFKCYKRKVLENIDLNSLSSVGYNFQIETTYRAYKKGFRIKEIPIIFTERKEGKSKFDIFIIFESFWKVLLLRFKKQ